MDILHVIASCSYCKIRPHNNVVNNLHEFWSWPQYHEVTQPGDITFHFYGRCKGDSFEFYSFFQRGERSAGRNIRYPSVKYNRCYKLDMTVIGLFICTPVYTCACAYMFRVNKKVMYMEKGSASKQATTLTPAGGVPSGVRLFGCSFAALPSASSVQWSTPRLVTSHVRGLSYISIKSDSRRIKTIYNNIGWRPATSKIGHFNVKLYTMG